MSSVIARQPVTPRPLSEAPIWQRHAFHGVLGGQRIHGCMAVAMVVGGLEAALRLLIADKCRAAGKPIEQVTKETVIVWRAL